jgi:transcriptional regulator with XRE-family HTH domain
MRNGTDSDFARTFGNALNRFLEEKGMTQSEAAEKLGLNKEGKKQGKARISSYCHDSPDGRRPKPSAEVLYLLCTQLDFAFEYKGYKISAATLNGKARPTSNQAEQLPLGLDRQFDLTDQKGAVSVTVRQPPGRVEVSLSLKAKF